MLLWFSENGATHLLNLIENGFLFSGWWEVEDKVVFKFMLFFPYFSRSQTEDKEEKYNQRKGMAEVLRVSDGERSELQNLQWECELLGLPSSFWIKQNIYGFCWV